MITRVLVLGSCVSRDPFGRTGDPFRDFVVVDYFARTSLASLASLAMKPHGNCDLSAIKSPFQRKMVQRDMKKEFLVTLETLNYDVLLLDFIDDRFGLICLSDGSAITDSNEFRTAKLKLNDQKPNKIAPFSEEFLAAWQTGWSTLKALLGSLDRLGTLLVNDVFWCQADDKGVPFENCDYIEAGNRYLSRIYDILRSDIDEHQFIDYRAIEFIGRTDHPWGRSPYHYTKEIEDTCLASVKLFHLSMS